MRRQNGKTEGGIQLDFFGPLQEGFEKLKELQSLARNLEDRNIVDKFVALAERQLNDAEWNL